MKVTKTQYPGVYCDEKGDYFYQIYLGTDPITGKKITKKSRKSSNGKPFKSARSANAELTKLRSKYLEERGKTNYKLTVNAFLNNSFLPMYKMMVKETTYLSHKKIFQRIGEFFGDKRLVDLTVIDCENYKTWLLKQFSQSYASINFTAFRQILDYAVKLEFISSNVSRRTKAISKTKAPQKFWDKYDFENVISQIYLGDYEQNMHFIVIWLFFMTGIRVGEGQALKWSDIDLDKKNIRIFHNLAYKNRNNYTINAYTKTESGMRIISIDSNTVEFLKKWKTRQQAIVKSEFVLSAFGDPIPRSTIKRIIMRYAKLAGVAQISGKGLRHSHASYLINEFNADVLTVSRRLGHSSPEITLKYYSHLWKRNDEYLAQKMNNNIALVFSNENKFNFNGNQYINKNKSANKIITVNS